MKLKDFYLPILFATFLVVLLLAAGSDGFVKAWNDFRAGAGADTAKVFHAVGQLLSEMRKDCGHYGSNLNKFDLLSVLIKTEDLLKLHGTLEAKN